MSPDPAELDSVIERFKHLGQADQVAVLDLFPTDERDQILAAMTERELARQSEQAAAGQMDRRYAAYSPWLATLVRSADAGASDKLTPVTARTLVEGHRLLALEADAPPTGLYGQVRGWFIGLFAAPQGEPR